MADGGYIQVEGLDRVLHNLARTKPEVAKAAADGMVKQGMRVIADATRNIRRNRSWKSGLLGNSGRVERVDKDGANPTVEIGFFDKDHTTGYAEYVEYGRPPGKRPRAELLVTWVRKTFHITDKVEALRVANSVSWGIGHHGTRPHPFFNPAVQQHMPRFARAIRAAVAKVINKDKS